MGWLVLGLAALAATPAWTVDPEIAAATVREDRFPATEARYAGGVVARPHIVFASPQGFRPLTLDLYMHEDRLKATPRPLVIWVHGGGWSRGDARTSAAFSDWPAVLASLAARGYVVASINYRLSSEAQFPAPVRDVRASIRFLRENAKHYGIDPGRVVLWGGSAGANLAAMAGLGCADPELAPNDEAGRHPGAITTPDGPIRSDCVQAIVSWYGLFDVFGYQSPNVARYLGCEPRDCPERVRRASPMALTLKAAPPTLLIHGTADQTIPVGQTHDMAARLKRAGSAVETLFIPGADHGWISATPGATRAAHLAALQRTFAFIDSIVFREPDDVTAP